MINQLRWIKSDRQVFFFSAALFLLLVFALEQKWDFYDGFVSHLVTGIASKDKLSKFYIYGFWGVSSPFKLAQRFTNLNVIGLLANVIIAIVGGLFTVGLWKSIQGVRPLTLGFIIGLVLLVLLPTFFTPSITGLSFLQCGAALWMIGIVNIKRNNPWVFIVLLGVYGFGMCIRQESGMGASLIVGTFLLLSTTDPKKMILLLSPFALVGALIVYFAFQSLAEAPFLHATEKALFYIADGGQNNKFYEGLSSGDSMKAKAIEHFYINDASELNPAFIDRIYQKKLSQQKPLNLLANMKISWDIASATILKNFIYIFLNLLILLFMLRLGKWTGRILFFQFFFWTIIFILSYTIKLEDRHYLYMAELYSICNVLFAIKTLKLSNYKVPSYLLLIGVMALLILSLFSVINEVKTIAQTHKELRQLDLAEKEVNMRAKGKALVLDVNSNGLFHSSPLKLRKFDQVSDIVYYDMAEMALLPEYNLYLDSFCQCDSRRPELFYTRLAGMKDETVIISTDYRVALLHSYLMLVHNKNLTFEKIPGTFAIQLLGSGKDQLNYYSVHAIDCSVSK